MKQLIFFILVLQLTACSVSYSFSGKSISPDVKTFSVQYIENRAPEVEPTLSDIFTEGLKEKFRTQGGLIQVNRNGDLEIEGSITEFSRNYQGVANQQAAQTRFTIRIKISFTNNVEPSKSYEKTFSHYEDFDANENFDNVKDKYIQTISEKIINDIFMESVADW